MAQIADDSLAARIAALESQVRSLAAGAAVGATAVGASNAASVTLTGVASTAGVVPWSYAGPSIDLYAVSGRLRVDVAAAMEVWGNKASLYVGYRVTGPVDAAEDLDVAAALASAAVLVAPDYDKSTQLQDDAVGMNQLGAFSTFDLVTIPEDGWYRVTQAYALAYSGTTPAPYGIASARRLAVQRY